MDLKQAFHAHRSQVARIPVEGEDAITVSFCSFVAGVKFAESRESNYPPCDFCGCAMNEMPWHGSGLINGAISRHIHACNDCRDKLPAPLPSKAKLKMIQDTITSATGVEFGSNEPRTVSEADLLAVFEAGIKFASKGE